MRNRSIHEVAMLSSTADYAVRAILLLARHRGGPALRAEEIARATGAPSNYMAKTLA
jgi:Rrf2 family iron-sulfur cluster assembly transcriptional regulator